MRKNRTDLPNSRIQAAFRSGLPAVLAEWAKPGHGVLGPPFVQLAAINDEARALVASVPLETVSQRDLQCLVQWKSQLLLGIWALAGLVLSSGDVHAPPTPTAQGGIARTLVVLSLLFREAESEDPLGWVFMVYLLDEFGERAALELERRMGRAAGDVAELALTSRLPHDQRDPLWAFLERVVPGVDCQQLASRKANALRALEAVAEQIRQRLPWQTKKGLAREEAPARKSLNEGLRDACARATIETLCSLTTDDLVSQSLGQRLVGTIVDRVQAEVEQAKQAERQHQYFGAEGALDQAAQQAKKDGRLPRTPPEQEITVLLEQDDEQTSTDEIRRRLKDELGQLVRQFLKAPEYRKHRDGMQFLSSDKSLKTLARRRRGRATTTRTVINRRDRARRDFLVWLGQQGVLPAPTPSPASVGNYVPPPKGKKAGRKAQAGPKKRKRKGTAATSGQAGVS